MALVDSIIGAESGGNPNAQNPNSSAGGHLSISAIYVPQKLYALPLIGKLLLASGPSAILWRVISVYVNAVNRVIGRRLYSHISEKITEAITPTLANLNAPRSVVFVGDVFGVFAPGNHREPSSIFRGSWLTPAGAPRSTMSRIGCDSSFNFVTSAAFSVAGLEVWDGRKCHLPAIASAIHAPDGGAGSVLSNFGFCLRNGDQFSKSHSNVILAGHV